MEAISKLAIAAVDLAEAELASLQRGTIRLVIAIAAVFAGGVLAVAGVWMLLWAGYRALSEVVGPIGALAITGAVFAGIGGALLLMAWKRITGRKAPTAAGPRQTSDVTSAKRAEEAAASKTRVDAAGHVHHPEGAPDDPASLRIAS